MRKRILATVLSLCLVLSLLPTVAFAAETTNTPAPAKSSAVSEDTQDTATALEAVEEEPVPDSAAPEAAPEVQEAVEQQFAAEEEELEKHEIQEVDPDASVYTADEGKVEVTMSETGTLQDLVEATAGYVQEDVTHLVVSTEPGVFMNHLDFAYARMELPNLQVLDITNADCVNDVDPTNAMEHEIPNNAMNGKRSLQTVLLSTKINSIASGAFSGCTGLRGDLVIPDNITHLGKVAFGFWGSIFPSLDSLTMSKNMEVMESGAFLRCKISGSVTLPASLTYMGGDWTYGGVFQECRLDGIVFEEGSQLEYIGSYCFSGNPAMQGELKLPDSLTYIGGYAFSGAAALTGTWHIPANLKTLGGAAFNGCSGVTGTLEFPESLATIGGSAFATCTGVTGVTFSEGLTTIGDSAFRGCTGLTGELKLPDSLKTIEGSAFLDCTGLTALDFGNSLETIGANAFQRDAQLTGTIVFPETLNSIGNYAFQVCTGLTGIQLPKTLETLGVGAFQNCENLSCEDMTLPQGLQVVGDNAFYNCKNLTGTLTIPNDVEEIKTTAFYNTGFTAVEFGAGLKKLGNGVFQNSKLDGEITVPQGLESIGTFCFHSTKITALAYHGSGVKDWGNNNYFGTLSALETLDFSGSGVEKLTWTTTIPTLKEVKLPETLQELTLTSKRNLETIDLTHCSKLTNVDLYNNAIDFSGGKPAEWLASYTGTKRITMQYLLLYAAAGKTERTIAVGEEFQDDITLTTKNGTDLSSKEKWLAFRSAYQNNPDTSKNWVAPNLIGTNFLISRTPTTVDTSKPGVQTIWYSTGDTRVLGDGSKPVDHFNYKLVLTVGDDTHVTPPSAEDTVTVVQANGNKIGTGGYGRTYMDLPFALVAKVESNAVDPVITWGIYADEACTTPSDTVLKHNEKGLFEIVGVGTVWVRAQAEINGGTVNSAPVKIYVNRRDYTANLTQAKSKTYGAADPANLNYAVSASLYGHTEQLQGVYFTREEGELVGKYQTYLYAPEALQVEKPHDEATWAAYTAAAKAKFEADNPNFKLNVTCPKEGADGNFTVNPRQLGVGWFGLATKYYDTTADAQISTTTPISNIAEGDLDNGVTVNVVSKFDSPNVKFNENGTAVQQDGEVTITLTGDKLWNYTLPNGYTSGEEKNNVTWTKTGEGDKTVITVKRDGLVGWISQRTIYCYINPKDKVYDGTVTTEFEGSEQLKKSLTGLCEEDQKHLDSIKAVFADKNVGTNKEITLTSEYINFSNYKMPALTASITPRALNITGLTAESKAYDGTVTAQLSGTPIIQMNDVVSGDAVSIQEDGTLEGAFYDKNVGTKKSVVVATGLGLTGEDAGNYYLRPTSTLYADITPIPLTVVPDADQYKTVGAVDPQFTYTLQGLVESDIDEKTGGVRSGVMRGMLFREPGEESGSYAFTLGTLQTTRNYNLQLAEDAAPFVIRNTNAYLQSISTSNGVLSPSFHAENESYTVKLPTGTTTVPTITAEAAHDDAVVEISKAENLGESTTVTVTAADGVTKKTYTIQFVVADAVAVTATVVNASADGNDGMIVAAAAGGSGRYEFSLDQQNWQSSNVFAGQRTGNYTVYVRDAAEYGNTASASVTVAAQPADAASVPAPASLTAAPDPAVIPYSADSLDITLTADGVEGASYYYSLDSGVGTLNGNVLTVTEPGTVVVKAQTVKDGVLSETAKSLTVNVTKAKAVSAELSVTDADVYGGNRGKITVNAAGGLGTYQYRIENGAWVTDAAFSKLFAGTYTISVRDAQDFANMTSQTVYVGQANATPAVAIREILDSLTLGDTSGVTEDLLFPTEDSYGGTTVGISWTTEDPSVVGEDGTVTRPPSSSGNKTIIVKATLTCDGITKTKTFEVTVLAKNPPSGGSYNNNGSYMVVVNKPENGNAAASATTAKRGDVVTITVAPDKGYALDTITAVDVNDKAVQLTNKGNGKYTFIMPASRVTITAAFRTAQAPSFVDVPEDAYFADAVDWAGENGITNGVTNDRFGVGEISTRAQVVTFLWRTSGSPEPGNINSFADVSPDAYYAKAVAWAVEQGITKGTSATEFSPDETCTRGQIVTFLWRAEQSPEAGSAAVVFADVSADAYYAKAVAWAVEQGITKGTSATEFSPNEACAREQVVTFLWRCMK